MKQILIIFAAISDMMSWVRVGLFVSALNFLILPLHCKSQRGEEEDFKLFLTDIYQQSSNHSFLFNLRLICLHLVSGGDLLQHGSS